MCLSHDFILSDINFLVSVRQRIFTSAYKRLYCQSHYSKKHVLFEINSIRDLSHQPAGVFLCREESEQSASNEIQRLLYMNRTIPYQKMIILLFIYDDHLSFRKALTVTLPYDQPKFQCSLKIYFTTSYQIF